MSTTPLSVACLAGSEPLAQPDGVSPGGSNPPAGVTPYAAQTDLVPARMSFADLVDLTDDTTDPSDPVAGRVNPAIVTSILATASGIVDSYCRQRYSVPLQPSLTITGLTIDIAVYLLFTRRRETKLNETVATRYGGAIAFLKDIGTGKASLDQPANAVQQGASGGPVVTQFAQRFDDCNLEGWA